MTEAVLPPTDTDRIELSIVIVSYNTRQITLECLESVFRYPPAVPFEVILLDNASHDESAEAIIDAFPQVRVIASPDNLGFAAGNNAAARHARGRRILLLNPDTVVFQDTFAGLWDFAEREPDRGIWGGRTYFADMSLNAASCWRDVSLWSLFCIMSGLTHAFNGNAVFDPESYGAWRRDSERDVDIVVGCFLLIDAELWARLKGFDPHFFMYAEESDLCIRARKLGARPGITPNASLIHLGGASEVHHTDRLVKILRGRVTLIRKHWAWPRQALGRAMMLAWAGSRTIASRFTAGRRDDPLSANQKWLEIWRRRREWLAGYPAPVERS